MVRVKFSGALCQIAGSTEVTVALPASGRLGDLLASLAQNYPGILGTAADYQWRHGSSHVMIAVNGVLVEGESPELSLADGDEISLVPPLGGGCQRMGTDKSGR